ncbi:hypothetical protein WJX79_006196 [Trebouxia sp. C0005]
MVETQEVKVTVADWKNVAVLDTLSRGVHVTPWWNSVSQQYELCRATKQKCHFKEVCHRECFYDVGEDGTSCKKCVSKVQLLKLCPGRNDWESVTSRDLQETEQGPFHQHRQDHTPIQCVEDLVVQNSLLSQHSSVLSSFPICNPLCSSKQRLWEPSQAALQSEVGEQWEEFLRYALELQRQLAKESSVSLEPEPPLPRQRMMDVPAENKSVLQRLFKRESPVAGTKSNFAKLWKDYAAYGNIEEV